MYIALKWLILLSLAMWATLCCIDMFVIKGNKNSSKDSVSESTPVFVYKNVTIVPERRSSHKQSHRNGVSIVHYLMFIAGALVVSIYNRKSDIVIFTRKKILKINVISLKTYLREILGTYKNIALEKWSIFLEILRQFALKRLTNTNSDSYKPPLDGHLFNALLLKKLREVREERNNMAQLLYAAVQENKNIRMQYQLETMAKNRLSSQIEDTQKQMKEYRTRCISLKQLYLVTHQENVFLKARVQKLSQEKQDAEKDFMVLFTEAYQSSDVALKNYCNRFIVMNKDNFLHSDLSKQILRFVQKSRHPHASTSTWHASRRLNISLDDTRKLPVIEEVDSESKEQSISLVQEEPKPKLRGLPGEYVWTVKDKDGIIEKLYEYDYGCDFDNGDTIRRIREYTVYHDKDCLLDFMKSTTIIHESRISESETILRKSSLESVANRKFLTGSEIFQRFLESNNNNVVSRAPAPPLLCG